ncbi:MAG: LLM class flavin-dependent oxidoreductase [Rhizomicrobium sp.]
MARQFASLDHISSGRAGWNVVTSWLEGSASNFSKTSHYPHDVRYRLAGEYLDVVQGLWDSWEDDALVRNKETGQFLDSAKLHSLNHSGEFFSVKGPLNISRSRQGQPVIFQAGASEDGKNFAAKRSDAIFVAHDTLDEAKEYYRDIKPTCRRLRPEPGRRFHSTRHTPRCRSRRKRCRAQISGTDQSRFDRGMRSRCWAVHSTISIFSVHDLDAPFPDVAHAGLNSNQSASNRIVAFARKEGLTPAADSAALRYAAQQILSARPVQVADALEQWLVERGWRRFQHVRIPAGPARIFCRACGADPAETRPVA